MFSGAEQGADAGEDRRVREELGVSHKFCVTQILLGKLKTSSLRTHRSLGRSLFCHCQHENRRVLSVLQPHVQFDGDGQSSLEALAGKTLGFTA